MFQPVPTCAQLQSVREGSVVGRSRRHLIGLLRSSSTSAPTNSPRTRSRARANATPRRKPESGARATLYAARRRQCRTAAKAVLLPAPPSFQISGLDLAL
eukprot:6189531-Pleurochrysis_carterae.AAC.3